MQVAQTILAQLGGNRFIAMTGAKDLVGGDDYLQFKLNARMTKNKCNLVVIRLVDDLYTLEFKKYRNLDAKVIETIEGVYVDTLRTVFTNHTGLDTHL